MRRVLVIAALSTLAVASAAQAETWKPYSAVAPNSTQWSFDSDYSYLDKSSGRVVVMQAIGKVGAEPRLGPSGPGKPDGAGSVVALDCKASNLILIGSYSPKKAFTPDDGWRRATPKKVDSAEDKALLAAACENAKGLPTK
jgi:hypothetical protein